MEGENPTTPAVENARNLALEPVLKLVELGYSVIPLAALSKRPPEGFRWDEHTRRRANAASVTAYHAKNPDANWGIVCGRISNLLVVDIDTHGADPDKATIIAERISCDADPDNPAPTVRTGSGGYHIYFCAETVKTTIKIRPDDVIPADVREHILDSGVTIDIKSERSYVVAPPSIHPDTKLPYHWMVKPEVARNLTRAPEWLLAPCRATGEGMTPDEWDAIINQTGQGNRNGNAVKLAGKLFGAFPMAEWPSWIRLIKVWNQYMVTPPLPERELDAAIESIMKIESRRHEV